MKAGNLLKLAAPVYVNNHAEHLRNDMVETLNVLLSAAETFNHDLAVVQADRNLSPDGKNAARVRVAAAALATLTAIESTTIKKLADHASALESSLRGKHTYAPPKDAAERVSHDLRLQEIRNQLRQLTQAERVNLYRSTTDAMILAAIDTAPPTLSAARPDGSRQMEPFIDPAEQDAAKMARAEAADPETAAKLREVSSLQQAYRHAVNGLRAEVLEEVPGAASTAVPTLHVA
jgi:hypothetical protein